MRQSLWCILLAAFFLCLQPLWAERDLALEKQARAISASVMSPYCEGRLLQDCPSSQATELREKIRTMLGEGQSPQQVMDYLYAVYGPEISAIPKMSGFGTIAWLAPIIFLLSGGLFLTFWIRRKRQQPEITQPISAPDAKMLSRIESEVSR